MFCLAVPAGDGIRGNNVTFIKIIKILLALAEIMVYTSPCCDMIAKKREVATNWWVFPWSECQEVEDQQFRPVNLTASHCTEP